MDTCLLFRLNKVLRARAGLTNLPWIIPNPSLSTSVPSQRLVRGSERVYVMLGKYVVAARTHTVNMDFEAIRTYS